VRDIVEKKFWRVFWKRVPVDDPVEALSAEEAIRIVKKRRMVFSGVTLHAEQLSPPQRRLHPQTSNPRYCEECGYLDPASPPSDTCPSCDEPRQY